MTVLATCQRCGAEGVAVILALVPCDETTAAPTLGWQAVCSACYWASVRPETRWQEAVMR
jgi:hypothetical protein